eukprot:5359765-Ditylum_brightwellii.AAC.1
MLFCNFCKERWFLKKCGRTNPESWQKRMVWIHTKIKFLHHLPKLSKIKEMLITCVYPVLKTYCLKGGTIGYKRDVLNIEQDIG